MQIELIALEKLHAHPLNPNVMSDERLAKLQRHIERTGQYEPLVVREHPQQAGAYQLINGHHRAQVLGRLGRTHADCVVWQVSDEQAMLLLATLNRLTGSDDPKRRAGLLERLSRRYEKKKLLALLPERSEQLERIRSLDRPVQPVHNSRLRDWPEAMTFMVNQGQKQIIERALQQVREQIGGEAPDRQPSRGDLLACLAQTRMKSDGQNSTRGQDGHE